MALNPNINNLEKDKFSEVSGETAVRVDVVQTVGGGGGDATAANQVLQTAELVDINSNTDTANTLLTSIDATLSDVATESTLSSLLSELQLKADLTETQPVSAASLPLPSGASTAANQSTGNASLASIDGKITAVNTGAVVVSSSALPSGAATSANQSTAITQLNAINANTDNLPTALGQTTMAASLPVAIASNQSAVPISAASLPLPTGAATEANQTTANNSLSVMDDWDESDRCKTNPIVGQAGVQGGSGTVSALTQRVVLATDVALPAGTNNIGDVDVLTLPAIPAGTNSIGKVVPEGSASGVGLSFDRRSALSNTAVAVKAGSGRVYGYHFYNPNTSDAFVQFYNVAQGSVTVGTTTPDITLWIPSGGALDTFLNIPISFSTAITIAATTTVTGGSAPSTGLLANTFFI